MPVYVLNRKDSQFVWLKWWNPRLAKWEREATRIRKAEAGADIKVAKARNRLEAKILAMAGPSTAGGRESGWHWVIPFLRTRYGQPEASATLAQYLNRWDRVAGFVRSQDIRSPGDFTREHAFAYFDWRTALPIGKRQQPAGRNTAKSELKLLAMILEEAVDRKLIESNPAKKLKIKGQDAEEKPELLAEEVATIRAALATAEEWMRVSWEIAFQTGLRFSETRIDLLKHVNFIDGAITIPAPKGGRRRAFSRPLPDDLLPLLRSLRAAGRKLTWDRPAAPGQTPPGIVWRRFFDGIGLPHICFHCTRVTYISAGFRSGIPESAMMKLVNHGAVDVHRIYQRLSLADGKAWAAKVRLPGSPAEQPKP